MLRGKSPPAWARRDSLIRSVILPQSPWMNGASVRQSHPPLMSASEWRGEGRDIVAGRGFEACNPANYSQKTHGMAHSTRPKDAQCESPIAEKFIPRASGKLPTPTCPPHCAVSTCHQDSEPSPHPLPQRVSLASQNCLAFAPFAGEGAGIRTLSLQGCTPLLH